MKWQRLLNIQSTNFVDIPRRLGTGHAREDVASSIMPADIACENTLLDESSGSMSQQSKIGVARFSINESRAIKN